MAQNLPMTILVLGGGAAMIWTGIADPAGGLIGQIGNVLSGKKSTPKSSVADSGAALNELGQGAAAGANTILGQAAAYLTSSPAVGTTNTGGSSSNGVVAAAQSQLGVAYVWGGGGSAGPSDGGFDCSGLTQYAWAKGAGISIPRVAAAQQLAATPVSVNQAAAGDSVFFGSPAYHTGIYLGGGQMIHAPHPGTVVKVEAVSDVTPGPTTYGYWPTAASEAT